ncbi:VOC family protein [Maritimibacter sp. DP1N21-5]|uniref:VOC family protein n=1 Tax=Maritimibacter sp. DP1N21-5 TaxID=2836867 RepID=UPI001C4738DB|nr:VOC family protein [Maritimibacter sp. DP1N21-5]MBV7410798.1 VOC family protein [Maritimibacter sp. DP1N21-5]
MPIPYIVCRGAAEAIEFYRDAFGATEDFRMTDPGDGRIGHAELNVFGGRLMLADEYPDFGAISPDRLGGTAVTLYGQVPDVDLVVQTADAAGATVLRAPADQSFGERTATLMDPFGHRWMLAQVIERLTGEEMQRRWEDEVG